MRPGPDLNSTKTIWVKGPSLYRDPVSVATHHTKKMTVIFPCDTNHAIHHRRHAIWTEGGIDPTYDFRMIQSIPEKKKDKKNGGSPAWHEIKSRSDWSWQPSIQSRLRSSYRIRNDSTVIDMTSDHRLSVHKRSGETAYLHEITSPSRWCWWPKIPSRLCRTRQGIGSDVIDMTSDHRLSEHRR